MSSKCDNCPGPTCTCILMDKYISDILPYVVSNPDDHLRMIYGPINQPEVVDWTWHLPNLYGTYNKGSSYVLTYTASFSYNVNTFQGTKQGYRVDIEPISEWNSYIIKTIYDNVIPPIYTETRIN